MNTILITGGSGKVGLELVNHFLQKGMSVVTTCRNKKRFFEEKGNLISPESKEKLTVIEVDFTKENAIGTVLQFLKNHKILLDSIVHNARSLEFLKIEPDNSVSEANFAGEFYMDVIFPYKLSLEILKIPNQLQNIIFVASVYGVVAPTPTLYENFPGSSPIHYGVSKAAQIHLTKELAVRLAPNVRVNCVSFGGIKGRTDKGFEERYNKLNPLNRMLREDDVRGPVDFLISDSSKSMTGQNIIVDGGWSIW